jgi:hypothetical protein
VSALAGSVQARCGGIWLLAAETLRAYSPGPKSTVASTLEALVEHEVLVRDATNGSTGYRFDDPFFRRWVEVNALPDLGRSAPPLPRDADPA